MDTQVEITVEALAPDRFVDLIKTRKQLRTEAEQAISVSYKDLLVVTRFKAHPFGPVANAINKALDSLLDRAIEGSKFTARQGETLMVELESVDLPSGNARRILVVGLGEPKSCPRFQLCALFSCLINEATTADAEHIILPVVDLVSTAREARALTSVLKCRIDQHLSSRVEHGRLKRIRLLVDTSMKEDAEAGLADEQPICKICSEPEL